MVESCTSARFYITDTFSENGGNSFFAWSLAFSSVKKKSLIFALKGWNDPKLRFFGFFCKFLSVHFTEIYLKWKLKERLSFLRKPMSKKILVLKLWLKKTLSQSMTETQNYLNFFWEKGLFWHTQARLHLYEIGGHSSEEGLNPPIIALAVSYFRFSAYVTVSMSRYCHILSHITFHIPL